MNKKRRFSWSPVWEALMLLALLAPSSAWADPAKPMPALAPVDQEVRDQIKAQGSADFWVILEAQADLSGAEVMSDWTARGQYVVDQLQAVAKDTQTGVIAVLAEAGVDYKPYWIVNAIWANGDGPLVSELSTLPEVERIAADRTYTLPEPSPAPQESQVNGVEWNIDRIHAPQVWSTYGATGEGIVVANIDTGVQYDHPALVGQYRGNLGGGEFDHNYNWFDPSNMCGNPSLVPCDNIGHGTHTMGTMVGDDGAGTQIGVAPGARFIMAKGCEHDNCSFIALMASMQWILAPTDLTGAHPRPELRPHVVNNSWGGVGGDFWYQGVVQAWVASGIFPAFAIGNDGPGCGSAISPGDYAESYAAGGFDINNNFYFISSRGPAVETGLIKPNISAPAVSISSSVPPDSYTSKTGTSMASPHVAATVALMWSAAPSLLGDIAQTRLILDQTAIDTSDLSCGGTAENNNVWGQGRLDAFAAVSQSPIVPVGVLQGRVTEAGNGLPLAGAAVQAVGPITRHTFTDANGFYYFPVLAVGSYDVSVRKFGYLSQTESGVVITEEATTGQDFALSLAAMVTVEGKVTDGSGHAGMPLYASLDISDYPNSPVYTDPVSGHYSLELPVSETFTFNVSAVSPGYNTETRDVTAPPGGKVEHFALTVDEAACVAPGYNEFCTPLSGGLLVGNVYDLNSEGALNGAVVASDGAADHATSGETRFDPNLDEGFYMLFSTLIGTQPFTASFRSYGNVTEGPTVVVNGAVRQDFDLPAGRLETVPKGLTVTLNPDQTEERTLTLSNTGDLAADFGIIEIDLLPLVPEPDGQFAGAGQQGGIRRRNDLDARAEIGYSPPDTQPLSAGEVINTWPTGLVSPWGIGLDTIAGDLWIGDMDDRLTHRFLPDGTNTGDTIDTEGSDFDMTYNPLTGMLWQINSFPDNCIHELDPAAMILTGKKICPAFPTFQRGLAYDPISNTFYSGSWDNDVIYHFDTAGIILDSKYVSLDISGLAFNPSTGSLFVMTNSASGYDVYVLDVNNSYNVLGGFDINGLGAYEQAGLEIDCNGTLWAVNQTTDAVIAAESGESSVCNWADIPWLAESPVSGTVAADGEAEITLTFNSTGLDIGTYEAHLRILENTPYPARVVPVTLIVTNEPLTADLAVSLEGSPDPVAPGEQLAYTVSVTNAGPSAAADVLVDMALPAAVTLVSMTPSQGSCAALPGNGGQLLCNLESLVAGGNASVTVVVEVDEDATGILTATAKVSSGTLDPYMDNNCANKDVFVVAEADLAVSLAGAPDPVVASELLTYTVTVTNAGPDTAQGMKVKLPLPEAVTLISVTPSQGSCSALPCNLGSMAAGDDATVTVVVEVKESASGNLTTTAQVSATTLDPDGSNNSDTLVISVEKLIYRLFLPLIQKPGGN